jgi:hypothetical protein
VRGRPWPATRKLQLLFVGLLPCALLSGGMARFILNLFYGRAPFLLDAGGLSAIVYRAGVIQTNPRIACDYAESYYGIHVSPLTSLFSILSYAMPVGRIEWYAIFQACVFVPIGLATYLVASRTSAPTTLRRIPITALAALGFAFSAQSMMCLCYPHHEAAIGGCICVVLASVATGRRGLMWLSFVFAVSVREDAGFHTGLALLPILFLQRRANDIPTPKRTVLVLIAIAFGVSLAFFAIQRVWFHSANLLRNEYLGDPAFAHLSPKVIVDRLQLLLRIRPFLFAPVLGAIAVAIARRDAGYLLGFAAAAPWFVLNLFALQEAKTLFDAYTGFPFLASLFWVYLYGTHLAPKDERGSPATVEATFALICIASTLVLARWGPVDLEFQLKEMAIDRPMNAESVRRFAEVLRSEPAAFGRLVVDDAVGSIALESLKLEQLYPRGMADAQALAFHQDDGIASSLLPALAGAGLSRCTHLSGTGFSVCRQPNLSNDPLAGLATEDVPPLLAFASVDPEGGRRAPASRLITVDTGPGLGFEAAFPRFAAEGSYEVVWNLDVRSVEPTATELVTADVVVNDVVAAFRTAPATPAQHELVVPFTAKAADPVVIRLWHRSRATFTIVDAELRRVASKGSLAGR